MKLAASAFFLSALAVPAPASANDALATALMESIQRCWIPPMDMTSSPKVKFTLGKDGSLVGDPEVLNPSDEMADKSAVRAILRCAPFTSVAPHLNADRNSVIVNFTMDESLVPPQAE